jgi:AcrR family transcriptional regulator
MTGMPMTAISSIPSDSTPSGDTRERILRAAEETFIRFGFEGARMEAIAHLAGVEKANIYYYFKGKRELYTALIDGLLESVVQELHGFLVSPGDSPWDSIDTFLDLLFSIIDRYRGLTGLIFTEFLHPPRDGGAESPIAAISKQSQAIGRDLIADGIAKGIFRDQDPAQAVISLEGTIFYYFLLSEERLQALTGEGKFAPGALHARKDHLRRMLRSMLEKRH